MTYIPPTDNRDFDYAPKFNENRDRGIGKDIGIGSNSRKAPPTTTSNLYASNPIKSMRRNETQSKFFPRFFPI